MASGFRISPFAWRAQSLRRTQLDVHRPTLAAVAARTKRPRRRTLFRSREESDERRTLRIGPFDVSSATAGLMQMWELGPDVRVAPGKRARRACDFGFGAVFAADENAVQPVMRVRCRVPYWLPFAPDAVLRLLPEPEAVLKGSWPVPLTGLRVGARLSLPFGAEQFDAVQLNARIPWRPHFSCKLYSSADRGPVQFSPRGLELAEQSVSIGRDTVLRLAATGARARSAVCSHLHLFSTLEAMI